MDLNPLPQTTKSPSNKKFIFFLSFLLFVLLIVGFLIFKLNLFGNYFFNNSNQVEKDSSLYSSANATFEGKILRVSDKKLIVENKQGVKGDITVAEMALVSRPGLGSSGNANIDLKKIQLNKEVRINSTLVDGALKAVSIFYLEDEKNSNLVPTSQTTASSSAGTGNSGPKYPPSGIPR